MLVHPVAELSDALVGHHNACPHLVETPVGSIQTKLLDCLRVGFSGGSGNSDIRSIHHALRSQVIRFFHSGMNGCHNNMFSFHLLNFHLRNDFRRTGIIDAIGDCIHFHKQLFIRETNDIPCGVLHSKDQFASIAIGKSDSSFQKFFFFCRDVFFVFYSFMLSHSDGVQCHEYVSLGMVITAPANSRIQRKEKSR